MPIPSATEDLQSISTIKNELTKQAYGSKANQVRELRSQLAKIAFEGRKQLNKAQGEVYDKRKELIKSINKFWPTTFEKSGLENYIEEADKDALSHLTDFSLVYEKEDPREYTVTFTFSKQNPYFKETVLEKSFTVPDLLKKETPYELDIPMVSKSVDITWSSDEQNLVKKSPKQDVSQLEEFDEFTGTGSFFNFFADETDDLDVGTMLQRVYEGALDFYAGFQSLEEVSEDTSDDEDDEDDADDAAEVDLGDSETDMPKKKKQKN